MKEKGYSTMYFDHSNSSQFEAKNTLIEIINKFDISSIGTHFDSVPMWDEEKHRMGVVYSGHADIHIELDTKSKPEPYPYTIKDMKRDREYASDKILELLKEFEEDSGIEVKSLSYTYRIKEIEDALFRYQKQVKIELDI